MKFRSLLCVSGLVCAAACSSDTPPSPPVAGTGAAGSPNLHVDNPGSEAGRSAAGSGGGSGTVAAVSGGSGGTSAAGAGGNGGSGGVAGAAGSGSGGTSAAGSGGSAGQAGSAGSSGAGGTSSGDPIEDLFNELFGPPQISCEGLLCLEDADCAALYPDETASCKLTSCVDFLCQ